MTPGKKGPRLRDGDGARIAPWIPPAAAAAFAIAVLLLLPPPAPRAEEESEAIRGTVVMVRPEALYLKDVYLPEEELASSSVMILLSDDTEYYDLLERTTRSEIVPGQVVLVKCVREGTERRAILVRIVVGKTP